MTRRLFLKRAGQASGVFAFLPAATAIGQHRHHHHHHRQHHHDSSGYYEHTIVAMGTTARVGVYAQTETAADEAINAAFAELKRLEALFTVFNASSEISRLNASAGGALLPCSADTYSILTSAKQYSAMTDGAFDATVEPLMELWGFRNPTNELNRLPTQTEIDAALRFVGASQIELADPSSLSATATGGPLARLRTAGAKLDLGSIAMGYSIDRMVTILKAASIEHGFINISGDMYAIGTPKGLRHGDKGWAVAIPDPNNPQKIIHWTHLTDQALSTAGNYESFVVYQAQKFGHIMNPHEGRSANRVLSATVIANRALDADPLSTASFVSGKKYADTALVLVDREGIVTSS